jgi:hypothetical protein
MSLRPSAFYVHVRDLRISKLFNHVLLSSNRPTTLLETFYNRLTAFNEPLRSRYDIFVRILAPTVLIDIYPSIIAWQSALIRAHELFWNFWEKNFVELTVGI